MHLSLLRNLLLDMLLRLRIKNPPNLRNLTLSQHLATLNWTRDSLAEKVEKSLGQGEHSSLCLAHGRVPITPVSTVFDH